MKLKLHQCMCEISKYIRSADYVMNDFGYTVSGKGKEVFVLLSNTQDYDYHRVKDRCFFYGKDEDGISSLIGETTL